MRRLIAYLACHLAVAFSCAIGHGQAAEEARPSGRERAPARAAADQGSQRLRWNGPRVEIAYRVYSLKDSLGGGSVNAASFSGFVPSKALRAGGGVELGARSYEFGTVDGLASGHIFIGYQHLKDLGRVVPYVSAIGELGVVWGKRFHTPVSHSMRGAGIEIGADVNLYRTMYVGLGLSYMVYTIADLAYDTFGMRLSIGL